MFNKQKILSLQQDPNLFLPATDEEKEYMVQMRESSTFFKDGLKRLLKNDVAVVSIIVIIVITLSAIFVPMFGYTAICFTDQSAWIAATIFLVFMLHRLLRKIAVDFTAKT